MRSYPINGNNIVISLLAEADSLQLGKETLAGVSLQNWGRVLRRGKVNDVRKAVLMEAAQRMCSACVDASLTADDCHSGSEQPLVNEQTSGFSFISGGNNLHFTG